MNNFINFFKSFLKPKSEMEIIKDYMNDRITIEEFFKKMKEVK